MPEPTLKSLKGVTFAHPRIVRPLVAAAKRFEEFHQNVSVVWVEHSLEDFEVLSLLDLSERFDLIAFDHPLLGDAMEPGCLLNLEDERPGLIASLEARSLGLSLESYKVGDALFGVPFDGAAQVSSWQVSGFHKVPPPRDLSDFLRFSSENGLESTAIPLLPAHAGCTLLTVAASVQELTARDRRFFLNRARLATAFDIVRTISQHSSARSFDLSPIALLDEMSTGSKVAYSPFTFGYGTYASSRESTSPLAFGESLRVSPGINRAVLGGAGIGVSSFSPHRKLAAEFAEFLVSSVVATGIAPQNFGQPGTRDGWDAVVDPQMKEQFFASTLGVMETGIVRPRFPGFVSFLTTMGANLVDCINSGASPDHFAQETLDLFAEKCVIDFRLEAIVANADSQSHHLRPTVELFEEPGLPSNKLLDGE